MFYASQAWEGKSYTFSVSVQVQCCFTSTETIRTVKDREPRTATWTLTQHLSSDCLGIVIIISVSISIAADFSFGLDWHGTHPSMSVCMKCDTWLAFCESPYTFFVHVFIQVAIAIHTHFESTCCNDNLVQTFLDIIWHCDVPVLKWFSEKCSEETFLHIS